MDSNNICGVCGFDRLEEPMYDINGSASFEICPCCGTEFGYHDAVKSHKELREAWIRNGMNWHTVDYKPENWDPKKQLENLA
jgi:predicted amidophosphoribosyltransferase